MNAQQCRTAGRWIARDHGLMDCRPDASSDAITSAGPDSAQAERPLSPLPCAQLVDVALAAHPESMAGLARWISEQHPDWEVAA
jgi:hypothetical protein